MITMLTGDCREVLRTLPDASVHCVVTSPPYWGLRDYGTATWEGGDPACDHSESKPSRKANAIATSGLDGGKSTIHMSLQFKGDCGHCGAVRIDNQLGLEPDFNAYVASMVGVFREVRRVLRDDGTLWLNLGDSYAGSWGNQGRKDERGTQRPINGGMLTPVLDGRYPDAGSNTGSLDRVPGLKPKDLCGIPWRVAFALQENGWYLRQDIIWSKPNPMPESVTDRCTKAHEYLFLLSKRERYYYDQEAIVEDAIRAGDIPGGGRPATNALEPRAAFYRLENGCKPVAATRNKRSVWEVTTQPFSEAHFATFPPALIEPCIKAGCPVGGTVLDPFAGAGTTGLVADRLQRNAILIELNPTYAAMGERRIVGDAPLFVEMAP